MANIPVGLQLYTLRDYTAQDFAGTLKEVAAMGYKTVEFAGYGGIAAKEMRNILDGLGLTAVSSHVGTQHLINDLDGQIEYSLEIGAQYIVCPSGDKAKLSTEDGLAAIVELFKTVGEKAKANGLTFCYHNHAYEFDTLGGKYVLDRLYEGVDASLLQAELDLFWVKKGGLDPKTYLLSYTNRCPIIHVKDMTAGDEPTFAEVGHGIIDYPSIFAVAEQAGVRHYIVEQDRCQRPAMESVKMSIDYLKSIGIA